MFTDTIILMPSPQGKQNQGDINNQTQGLTKHQKNLYESILAGRDVICPHQREESIFTINALQEEKLAQKGVEIDNGNAENEYHRKLIAYYRPTQIDYVSRQQIQEIMRFLKYFVENGYSQIFDQFYVSYRFPERDILKEFSENSLLATGNDFRYLSSIYAHTIHFSDGSPDFVEGTHPILANTPHKRWKERGNQHTHLPLEFKTLSSMTGSHIHSPTEYEKRRAQKFLLPKELTQTLGTVLHTIEKVEKTILSK